MGENFYTLIFVIDAKDKIKAEEIKCNIIKQLEAKGIYVFETSFKKGWERIE